MRAWFLDSELSTCFNKGYKMALYNFKVCEKDTCDMPFPSPPGSLKKQFDSAVIEEAK